MGEAPVPSSSSMKAGLRKIRAPIVSLAHKTEKKKANTWNSRGGQRMVFGTSFSKVDACFPQEQHPEFGGYRQIQKRSPSRPPFSSSFSTPFPPWPAAKTRDKTPYLPQQSLCRTKWQLLYKPPHLFFFRRLFFQTDSLPPLPLFLLPFRFADIELCTCWLARTVLRRRKGLALRLSLRRQFENPLLQPLPPSHIQRKGFFKSRDGHWQRSTQLTELTTLSIRATFFYHTGHWTPEKLEFQYFQTQEGTHFLSFFYNAQLMLEADFLHFRNIIAPPLPYTGSRRQHTCLRHPFQPSMALSNAHEKI